jgi:hypothetical protein
MLENNNLLVKHVRRLAADKDEITNTAREKQQPQDTVLGIELFFP